MPDADSRSLQLLRLYQRCQERGCLPYDGGVMDQPEAIMREFDVIDDTLARLRRDQREKDERDAELGRVRKELRGR